MGRVQIPGLPSDAFEAIALEGVIIWLERFRDRNTIKTPGG
jgi:hypothetical protein